MKHKTNKNFPKTGLVIGFLLLTASVAVLPFTENTVAYSGNHLYGAYALIWPNIDGEIDVANEWKDSWASTVVIGGQTIGIYIKINQDNQRVDMAFSVPDNTNGGATDDLRVYFEEEHDAFLEDEADYAVYLRGDNTYDGATWEIGFPTPNWEWGDDGWQYGRAKFYNTRWEYELVIATQVTPHPQYLDFQDDDVLGFCMEYYDNGVLLGRWPALADPTDSNVVNWAELHTGYPSAYITSPPPNSYVSGVVPLEIYADDNLPTNINNVVVTIDPPVSASHSHAATGSGISWLYVWDTTAENDGDGTYNIDLDVTEFAFGFVNNRLPAIPFKVDNTNPILTVTAPADGEILSSVYTIRATATDPNPATASGINVVEVNIDGTGWNAMSYVGSNNWQYDWDTFITTEGAHRVSVRAIDNAGNIVSLFRDVIVDNADPLITIRDPVNNQYVRPSPPLDRIWAEVADASPITAVQAQIDAGGWNAMTFDPISGLYYYDWFVSAAVSHTIEVRATDAEGNVGKSSVTAFVDSTLPSCDVVYPSTGAEIAGSLIVQATASDNAKLSRVELKIGTGPYVPTNYNTITGYWEYTWDTTQYSDASYDIRARATDEAGNTRIDADTTVLVDNTNPTLQIVAPVANEIIAGVYTLKIRATDTGSGITDTASNPQYSVDGGSWSDMSFAAGVYQASWDSISVRNGTHTLNFRVRDDAGNTMSGGVVIVVDNTPPACAIVLPLKDGYIEGTYTFQVRAADNLQVASLHLTFGGVLGSIGTVSIAYNSASGYYEHTVETGAFSDGSATVIAVAYDTAGNSYTTPLHDFYIDNTPPTLRLYAPQPNSIVRGNITFAARADDKYLCSVSMAILVDGVPTDWSNVPEGGQNLLATIADAVDVPAAPYIDILDASVCFTNTMFYTIISYVNLTDPAEPTAINSTYMIYIDSDSNSATGNTTAVPLLGAEYRIVWYADNFTNCWLWNTAPYGVQKWTGISWLYQAGIAEFVANAAGNTIELAVRLTDIGNTAEFKLAYLTISGVNSDITAILASPFYASMKIVKLSIDGGVQFTIPEDKSGNSTYVLDTTTLRDGVHNFLLVTTDWIGHQTVQMISIIVDNTKPSCRIVMPLKYEYIEGVYTIKVQATDAQSVGYVSLTFGGVLSPLSTAGAVYNTLSHFYEYTFDTTVFPDGDANCFAVVYDTSGNENSSAVVDFYVDNNPPQLVIVAPSDGSSVSGDYTIDLTGTTDAFPKHTQFKVDNGEWQPVKPTWSISLVWVTTEVADGVHTLTVRAADMAGHSTEATVKVIVDNTDPVCTVLAPLSEEHIAGTYKFKVFASDKVEIAKVTLCIYNGGYLLTTPMTYNAESNYYEHVVDTTAIPDGTYRTNVTVADISGRVQSSVDVLFHIDNTLPQLTIVAPMDGEYVADIYTINLTGTTDTFPYYTQFKVDNGDWKPSDLKWSTLLLWDTTKVADGAHTLTVRAADYYGHIAEGFVKVIVDNTKPSCAINKPVSEEYLEDVFTFRAVASDEVGIRTVELDVFNMRIPMSYNSVTNMYEYTIDTHTLADGTYTVSATATDYSGKSFTTQPVKFYIDNCAPKLMIKKPVRHAYITGALDIEAVANDTFLFKVEYSIDEAGWVDIKTPFNSSMVKDGEHVLSVRAIDRANHISQTSVNIYVDNTPPELLPVDMPADGEKVSKIITIKLDAKDMLGIKSVAYKIDNGNPVKIVKNINTGFYEFTIDTRKYPDGNHKITIEVTDNAGLITTYTFTLRFHNPFDYVPVVVLVILIIIFSVGFYLFFRKRKPRPKVSPPIAQIPAPVPTTPPQPPQPTQQPTPPISIPPPPNTFEEPEKTEGAFQQPAPEAPPTEKKKRKR